MQSGMNGEYTGANKLNDLAKKGGVYKKTLETIIVLLAPFAPHISEELWRDPGHKDSVFVQAWPVYDEAYLKDDEVEIVVQINGKARTTITIGADGAKDTVTEKAKVVLANKLNGTVVKVIYVPGRIVNIAMK